MPRSRAAALVTAPALVLSALVTITTVSIGTAPSAQAATYLSRDNLTMVSTRADGTAGPALPTTFGADEVAISDDGKVIAFTSPIPAPLLVTDPAQTGQVTDNNDSEPTQAGREDVFVWDSRLPAPAGPIVSLVSRNAAHTGTGDAASSHPVIAPMGLGVVFESAATDLTSTPVGAFSRHLYLFAPVISDIFPVFMVDQNINGVGSDSLADDPSVAVQTVPPSVKVAFRSHATDLVDPAAHSSSGADQVYVRTYTLAPPSTEMISVNKNNPNGTISGASEPQISADGSTVAFTSGGDGLMGPGGGTGGDIFIRKGSTTTLMSGTSATVGTGGNNSPVISADGKAVAWGGNSTSLPGVTHSNSNAHIYFRKVGGSIQAVDTDATGTNDCEGASNWPGISADGTLVAFESTCTDIVSGASGNQVFARRMLAAPSVPAVPDLAHAQLVSVNDAGTGSGNSDAFICSHNDPPHCGAGSDPSASINADGTAITFTSSAGDIATPPGGTPPFSSGDVFVRYPYAVPSGKTINLTTNAAAKHANGVSRGAVISKDGGTVAFVSLADDLVTPDGNSSTDVFAADLKDTYVIEPVNPVNEGDGHVTVTVTRTGKLATSDSVEVATGDGFDTSIAPNPFPGTSQAFEPGDYQQTDQTLSFPPGVAVQTFDVTIVDDAAPESPEAFHISLSAHSGAVNVPGPGPLSYAYVEILDNDGVSQDWSAMNTQSPATADVGDTVTVKTTITVDSGAQDLDVTSLASGAGTNGLDQISYDHTAPFTVPAGTSEVVTATARVTAAPGTAGVKLQTSVQGQLGAATAIRTADSTAINVTEAVSGVITGAPATVVHSDQITYTLTLTNSSDSPAQVTVPAFTTPAGTSLVSQTSCGNSLAAGATTSCDLAVDVDDADTDQTTITMTATGVTYAMAAVSLPDRPVVVAPAVSTVNAPVIVVDPHTMTDVNGATLQVGDVVHVSETVSNTGHAPTTINLGDAITNLVSPTNFEANGAPCVSCAYNAPNVQLLGEPLQASASLIIEYDATVANVADGTQVTSDARVGYTDAADGTSPTGANVASLIVGSTNQGWHVTVSQQPPASAQVGDEFQIKALVSVDPGPDSLVISQYAEGAATSGVDTNPPLAGPNPIAAGSTTEGTFDARVVAVPGTGGVLVQVQVDAALGAGPTESKFATTNTITVTEAVAGTLTGGPATVTTADQITYQLALTNSSDQAVQISGLPAALTAPAGTTAVGPASGPATIAANTSGTWTLTVDVDDSDVDGQVLTQTPGTVNYAMSTIGLAARPTTITPPSVSSTIGVPDTTKPDVTINKAGGQADPATGTPVHFTAVFTEPVTGFDSADILLGSSTAGGPLTTVITGGPTTYDVAVSGMSQTGKVVAAVAAGGAQDGSGNTNTASTSSDNSVDWIKTIASHTAVSTTPGSTVYGQSVTATATVTFDSGTSPGTVQFSVDGVAQGAPVVLAGGLATSAPLTGSGGVPLEPGAHSIGATFTPTALPYTASSGSQSLPVSKGTTTTAVVVGATTVTATVSVVLPAAGAPTGSVAFQVNGAGVGSAPVGPGGVATLTYTVPSGATANVGAAYSGDTHFTASSASTARNDPSITAKVSSAQGKSSFGWYRTPVKVAFTCTPNGSPLTAPCPDTVTINKNGGGQSVSKTITAQDGGMDTVTVNGIDIDQTAPTVSVGGVKNGGRYPTPGPKPTCVGKDGLSGIASCTIHTHKSGGALSTTVSYTVKAVDKAGNVTTKKGKYTLSGIGFKGAPFKNGAYTVHLNQTYLLVVHSVAEPQYLDAAPFPHKPFKVDPYPFRSAGHHLWSIPILMEPALAVHTYWNVGVLINGKVTVIKIRVLP